MQNTVFNNNDGYEGGGLGVTTFDGNITLQNSTFTGNGEASDNENGGGGARLVSFTGDITTTGNTFSQNYIIDGSGGGLKIFTFTGIVTVTNSQFTRNGDDGDATITNGDDTHSGGGPHHA